MSAEEEISNESVGVKEDNEYDVEADDHLGFDCGADPSRYSFYR